MIIYNTRIDWRYMGKWKEDEKLKERQIMQNAKRVTKLWTKEEEHLLMSRYVELGPDEIAKRLDRTKKSVIIKVHHLGAPRRQNTRKEWAKEEEEFLLKNYKKIGGVKCSRHLGRSHNCILLKAGSLGLTDDQRKSWTLEDEELLRKHSQDLSIADLQEILQRSRMSIIRHRQKMELPTKSNDYIGKDKRCYDSKQEKDIADLLYNANMSYKRGGRFYYNDGAWFRPDFIIYPNIVVEYFGLYGSAQFNYEARANKKINYFQCQTKYKLVALYPSDLRNGRIISKIKEVLK